MRKLSQWKDRFSTLEKGVDEEEEVLERLEMLNEEKNKKERGITEGERQGL